MGVVWRATDSTLGRDVAIKVLPDIFASDPERLARLDREARLLASLNHPNVASIYGLHTEGDVRFLAMELVEGEDLAQRIAAGPVSLAEALPLAHQIALALEHAHERGIVHRDLKPANVKLTADGQAKVLDFGLAKALEEEPASNESSPTMIERSPTITGRMTGANILIGTAAYMAPEQARGRRADRRADIWAFGVVLMEMITGRRLFDGETISDTLASVLKSDPDWSTLPAETPRRIHRLLRRCLERDPMKRLRDIGEARIALEEEMAGVADDSSMAAAPPPPPQRARVLALALGGVLVGAILAFGVAKVMTPPAEETPLRRFNLTLPESGEDRPLESPSQPALSPDGSRMVYRFHDRLWLQPLDALEPALLVDEPGAEHPFWSPDGQFVGYLSGARILKVPVAGGASQLICDTGEPFTSGSGASWGENDKIVYSHAEASGIQEVPARGGDPRTVLTPDSTETDFHEPHALPEGRGILFCAHRRGVGIDNIGLLAGGKRKLLLEVPDHTLHDPVYSSTGHILYKRGAPTPGIWALPFSLSRLEPTGDVFLVAENASWPSTSREGTIGYYAGASADLTQLAWVGRDGKELARIGDLRQNAGSDPMVSPDGERVLRAEDDGGNTDLWIYDTVRGTRSRLTFNPGEDYGGAWSPDGSHIAYHSRTKGCTGADCWQVVVRAANGTGEPDSIAPGAWPAFSSDGRYLVYTRLNAGYQSFDVMAVDLQGDRAPFQVVAGNRRALGGVIAPKGKYMAYTSQESGDWEIYLSRFPSGDGKWQVSASGGQWPRWSAAGDRLWFVRGDDVMEVDVSYTASAPVLGAPRKLFSRPPTSSLAFGLVPSFGVTRDGSRFAIIHPGANFGQVRGVTIVQNWLREFRDR